MSILTLTHLNGLTPHESVHHYVLRFDQGIDDASPTLLNSAFTPNATLDLTLMSSIGISYPIITGRDAIVSMFMSSVAGNLDTQHNVTNFRVNLDEDGKGANLTAAAVEQHYRKG